MPKEASKNIVPSSQTTKKYIHKPFDAPKEILPIAVSYWRKLPKTGCRTESVRQ